jgi:hypothetical protein
MSTPSEIGDARKKVLRAMARDCNLQKLKEEISMRERNKLLFLDAIEKEDVTIAEYEFMIAVREATIGG